MSDLASLHGAQRVAAFLLSLEPSVASELLKSLAPDVVPRVAEAMIDLDPRLARDGVVDELASELARALARPGTVDASGAEEIERLLGQAFGRRASKYVRRIRAQRRQRRPFLALEERSPAEIAFVLRGESVAVVALVLAHLDPPRAARVLQYFPEETALEVVRRIVALEPPSAELVRTVAEELTRRLAAAPPPTVASDPVERIQSVAEILNHSSPEMERKAIELLAESDAKAANELRERLFSWDDLATLGRRGMARVLGTVDTPTLAVALKGCSDAVERNVLANLSTRVRAIVLEERELAGAVPVEEVAAARSEILANVRMLIEAGELRPRRGGETLVS